MSRKKLALSIALALLLSAYGGANKTVAKIKDNTKIICHYIMITE